MADRRCVWLIPGDWHTPTGGFVYDRRLVGALREHGWTVDVHRLDGQWPSPDDTARAAAQSVVEALPDGSRVVADGLAYGVLPGLAQAHAQRLRWLPLVHHPLHLEAGLDDVDQARLRAAEAQALQAARHVVVTSASTVHDVVAMGVAPPRVTVIEPGTDEVPVCDARPPAARGGPVRLLCVATLTPRKGHALLLQALAGLPDLAWELHSVGSDQRDPALAARLHEASRHAPLAGRVHWHGEVDAATLSARYQAADLFVLPSLHEGYGMAVAEALAHGLPVLASRAGALAHTLPAGAGVHVPPGAVEPLRLALRQLIGDPALRARCAAAARDAAAGLPRWQQQAARWATLLEALA
jgi:glycosyltransferase involved in cell wall biosynthesis